MTNFEAIKAKVGYPLVAATFELALSQRGLVPTDIYTGETSAFRLAYADCLWTLLTVPSSIKEGGYTIDLSSREQIARMADDIYDELEKTEREPKPKAKFVQKW